MNKRLGILQSNHYEKTTALLMFGDSLIALSTTITTPYIALYLLKTTPYSSASVGWVVGLSVIIGIMCSVISGYISDRVGRGKLIYLSLFGSIGIYLLYYGSSFYLSNIFLMISFTILGGALNAFRSIYVPVSQAFIADYMPCGYKAKCFQLIYIASNLGAVFAPMVSISLGIVGTRSIFILSAIFYGCYVVLMLFLARKINFFNFVTTYKQKSFFKSLKTLLEDIRLRYHLLSCFAVGICCAQFDNTLSQYLINITSNPAEIYSMLILLNCLTVVIIQSALISFIKDFDISKMIVIGCIILSFGFFLMSFSGTSINLIVIDVIIISIGQVLLFPNFCRFIDSIAPLDLKGFYYGISFLRQLGNAVGIVMGGYFIKYSAGPRLFLLTALISIIAGILQAACINYTTARQRDL